MMGAQADRGWGIGNGMEGQRDVGTRETVARFDTEIPRIPGIAVRARQAKDDGVVVHVSGPAPQAEAGAPAVQVVGRQIGIEMVRDAVEFERRIGHAVGVAADKAVEVRVEAEVVGNRRTPEQHVGDRAIPVGDLDPRHDATEFDHLRLQFASIDAKAQELRMGLKRLDHGAPPWRMTVQKPALAAPIVLRYSGSRRS